MRRVSILGLSLLLGATSMGACSDPSTPNLAPNLIALELLDPSGSALNALSGADAGVPLVSPLSSIRATFDALLDPSKVQDLSGSAPGPGRGVAKVRWEAAGGITELGLLADYNPSKRQNYGPAPTLTFSAPVALPAGVHLTLELNRERITDKQARSYVGVSGGSFDTQPFVATLAVPQGALPTTFAIRIVFSSVPAGATAGAVRVFAGALEVPVVVRVEPPNVWVVKPVGEGVPWTSGAHRLVMLPNAITDTFGIPLPAGAYEFPFLIAGNVDGGVDGGATDAGADASAGDTSNL